LATIADTALDSKASKSKENEQIYKEFLNSLKGCLKLIADLFEHKFDDQEVLFFNFK
jgi:hypothetical protein